MGFDLSAGKKDSSGASNSRDLGYPLVTECNNSTSTFIWSLIQRHSPFLKEPFCFWQICASSLLHKSLLNKMHLHQKENVVSPAPCEFMLRSSDQSNHQKQVNCPADVLHHKLQPRKTMVMMKMTIAISSSHLRLKS